MKDGPQDPTTDIRRDRSSQSNVGASQAQVSNIRAISPTTQIQINEFEETGKTRSLLRKFFVLRVLQP